MKRVKTWAIFLIPLLYCGQLEAATNDSFTITITVNYIGIVLQDQSAADYTTWAIGAVTGGSTNTMASNNGGVGDQGIQVVNTSNYDTQNMRLPKGPCQGHPKIGASWDIYYFP